MAIYVTRPRRDEVRIGRGLPSADVVYGICRGLPSGQEVQCTILAALNAHLINNQIFPKESLVKI